MNALAPAAGETTDQYLVSYGKSGAVGVFLAPALLPLRRGAPVIIRTNRGTELGSVLAPATLRQARLLGAAASGQLLRPADDSDASRRADLAQRAEALFQEARLRSEELALEILDVDLLHDDQLAVLQYVGTEPDLADFAAALESQFGITIRLENLAVPVAEEEEEETHGGCGKPNCGQEAGGCTSCSSGGGCSSCSSGSGVDLRDYFSHLRTKMDRQRTPLL